MYQKVINSGRKSAIFVPIFLGLLFSAAARFNETGGQFKPYDGAFLLNGCFYGLLFMAIFFAFEKGMMILMQKRADEAAFLECDAERLPRFIAPSWSGMKKYMRVIALCWLPTYLLLFPGIVVGDTAVQIEQYLNDAVTDWHPFLETIVFGKFFAIGGTSHPMLGVGIFIALQMIVALWVMSYVAYYVQNIIKIRYVGYIVTILLAIYPIAPMSFMTMNKDTTFAICFILFCVLYCETWRSRGVLLKQPSFLIAFIVVSLSAMFTKKLALILLQYL